MQQVMVCKGSSKCFAQYTVDLDLTGSYSSNLGYQNGQDTTTTSEPQQLELAAEQHQQQQQLGSRIAKSTEHLSMHFNRPAGDSCVAHDDATMTEQNPAHLVIP